MDSNMRLPPKTGSDYAGVSEPQVPEVQPLGLSPEAEEFIDGQLQGLAQDLIEMGYKAKQINATLNPQEHIVTVTVTWQKEVREKGGEVGIESISKTYIYDTELEGDKPLSDETKLQEKVKAAGSSGMEAAGNLKARMEEAQERVPLASLLPSDLEAMLFEKAEKEGKKDFGYGVAGQNPDGSYRVNTDWGDEEKGEKRMRQAIILSKDGEIREMNGPSESQPLKMAIPIEKRTVSKETSVTAKGFLDKIDDIFATVASVFSRIKTTFAKYQANKEAGTQYKADQAKRAEELEIERDIKSRANRAANEERVQVKRFGNTANFLKLGFERLMQNPQEGLLRLSANVQAKDQFMQDFNNIEKIDENSAQNLLERDPALIGHAMKALVNNLSGENKPLLNREISQAFFKQFPIGSKLTAQEVFRFFQDKLSDPQREVLREILAGSREMLLNQDVTRMDAKNLAVVWQPNLMEGVTPLTKSDTQAAVGANMRQIKNEGDHIQNMLQLMIENYDENDIAFSL